jgi:MoaD family protein
MARLRLFANLREIAGTTEAEIEARTVGEVLESAATSYGSQFRRAMKPARVWLNGEPASPDDAVATGDEIALIPPVSGGATTIVGGTQLTLLAPVLAVVVLIVANLPSSPVWLVTALVAAGAVWVVDLHSSATGSGIPVQLPPMLATVLVAAVAPYAMAGDEAGAVGLGVIVAFSLVITFIWAIVSAESRDLEAVATTVLAQIVVGTGIGSLVLARLSPDGRGRVGAFLVVVIVSGLAWWGSGRLAGRSFLDPFAAGAIGAVLAAVVAAWLWELGVITFLFVGVVLALALIAGKGFGAMTRTGEVYLVDQPPGLLTAVDGPLLAAAIYYPILQLVL